MSKLDGYSPEDRKSITELMSFAVQVQFAHGHVADKDDAVRAAMPVAFEGVKGSVDYLNSALAQLPGLDGPAMTRVRNLALQLFAGTMEKCKTPMTAEMLLSWMRRCLSDARQTNLAVEEYLAG